MSPLEFPNPDVVIVGSGLAGLLLALELSEMDARVALVSKRTLSDSNTSLAQGGLAAVTPFSASDTPDLHLKDTLAAGAGLTDSVIASLLIKEASSLVSRLLALGVNFDRDDDGAPALALEGGHSRPRVMHVRDTTGGAITATLINRVNNNRNIKVFENALAVDLLLNDGSCGGVRLLVGGEQVSISAAHVVLCSGGAGQIFERTTNPAIATADGVAIAWRAGAVLSDLEFVQFHPTALSKEGAPAFLISEAVRGAGAVLLDGKGKRFAGKFHQDGELATRDVVARAIATTMHEQSLPCVWLDLRPIGKATLGARFPNIVANCRRWGVDPLEQPVPVSPAAHYFMGGIWTNANGQTTVPGLYAIGECASIGLHGANRLASNSLLEAGVMALRAARHIGRSVSVPKEVAPAAAEEISIAQPLSVPKFRSVMYRYAGVERDAAGLTKLFDFLTSSSITHPAYTAKEFEAANMLLVGQLIALSALARQESRGAHWRSDFLDTDNEHFARRQYISKEDVEPNFALPLSTAPVLSGSTI
jgi:L-aspartate oxidase